MVLPYPSILLLDHAHHTAPNPDTSRLVSALLTLTAKNGEIKNKEPEVEPTERNQDLRHPHHPKSLAIISNTGLLSIDAALDRPDKSIAYEQSSHTPTIWNTPVCQTPLCTLFTLVPTSLWARSSPQTCLQPKTTKQPNQDKRENKEQKHTPVQWNHQWSSSQMDSLVGSFPFKTIPSSTSK